MLFKRNHTRKARAFYPIYSRQIEQAIQASSRLSEMFRTNDHDEWRRLQKEVKACETAADSCLAEFNERLYETHLLVSGKTDLQNLAMLIDDFVDHIDDASKALLLYLPPQVPPQLREMAQYIEDEASAIDDIVNLMIEGVRANASAIGHFCERVTELEHSADAAYEEFIEKLFAEETDAVLIIRNKNIAEYLEATSDSAKCVTDQIRTLAMRYMTDN